MLKRPGIVAAMMLALAACSNVVPAPVEYRTPLSSRGETQPDPRPSNRAEAPQPSARPDSKAQQSKAQGPAKVTIVSAPATPGMRTATVQKGDTVYAIARRTGVSPRSIISANGLEAPYRIQPGQVLKLPAPRTHTVGRGDTIYGISRGYGVDMTLLARLNKIGPPYEIRSGQVLMLPEGGTPAPLPVSSAAVQPAQRAAQKPVSIVPVSPPAEMTREEVTSAPVAEQPEKPKTTAKAPAPLKPRVVAPADAPLAQPKAPSSTSTKPSRYGFVWPVRGKIISGFGPKGRGLHNDGVNISAALGTPVQVAADGVVAYAGNELRGYGNLLLIRHPNGYTTAYAHNDTLLVRKGQKVKRGMVIARAGRTGGVKTTQLHFEIRKGKQAVDPVRYLP